MREAWVSGLRYTAATIPYLSEWKMLADVDYVVGIEPVNTKIANRAELRAAGRLPTLGPGETREMDLEISVLEGSVGDRRILRRGEEDPGEAGMISPTAGFIIYGVHKDGLTDPSGAPFIDQQMVSRSRDALKARGIRLREHPVVGGKQGRRRAPRWMR